MFDSVTHFVSGSPLTYLIIWGIAALDAFFPVVPSETVVITAGTLASQGKIPIWLVLVCAALGSFTGDNISYFLGDQLGERAARRLFRGEKGMRRLRQAEHNLQEHGAVLIVAARFIPGGRTVTTFAAGTLDFSWRRFLAIDAVADVLWAIYAGMLGYLGGQTFQHSTWKALVLAFAIAAGVTLLVEVGRRLRKLRRAREA